MHRLAAHLGPQMMYYSRDTPIHTTHHTAAMVTPTDASLTGAAGSTTTVRRVDGATSKRISFAAPPVYSFVRPIAQPSSAIASPDPVEAFIRDRVALQAKSEIAPDSKLPLPAEPATQAGAD